MKGLIFDMDGTMIDNMMVHHRAWQKMLSNLGLEMTLEEVHQKVHGVNTEILEKLFGDRFTPEERLKISRQKEAEYREIFLPQLKLVDGLGKLIHQAKEKNIPMGIGSAAPPENVDFVMNNLNLWDYFDVIKHSDHVENGKPHPEIYYKVSEALGLRPEECLVFEDTPAGATAAQKAGSDVIVVTTTHQPEEFTSNDKIVRFIHDFKEVTIDELLAQFEYEKSI